MDRGFRQRRSKRLGFFGLAAQRLSQRPDETGIPLGRLNLNAHEAARRRATTVRACCLALRFGGPQELLQAACSRLYNRKSREAQTESNR
jgi:hypothetical protein